MPMLKNVLGLDLGANSLKAVEFKQALRGLEPVQMRIHSRASSEVDLGEQVQHLRHFFFHWCEKRSGWISL